MGKAEEPNPIGLWATVVSTAHSPAPTETQHGSPAGHRGIVRYFDDRFIWLQIPDLEPPPRSFFWRLAREDVAVEPEGDTP